MTRMKMLLFYLLIYFSPLIVFHSSGYAQINNELDFILTNNPIMIEEDEGRPPINLRTSSEIKIALMGIIRFYQSYISSQQNNIIVCTFTPGCSDFAMEAIEKHGAFYGLLLGADRIMRCCNYKRKKQFYPVHAQTRKYYDPVKSYHFKNKSE